MASVRSFSVSSDAAGVFFGCAPPAVRDCPEAFAFGGIPASAGIFPVTFLSAISAFLIIFSGCAIDSNELYEWLDDNPGIAAYPLEYVNRPYVISQIDNMVSINSCVAVDLYGQVAAESSGSRQISGTGGQLDFLIGASGSRGGKAFICMSSTHTDRNGVKHSRVKPQFNGDIITSPRSQVYFLATEYGVINLEGRSTWERAEALISIAHPDFRDMLIKEAQERKIWRRSNKR